MFSETKLALYALKSELKNSIFFHNQSIFCEFTGNASTRKRSIKQVHNLILYGIVGMKEAH